MVLSRRDPVVPPKDVAVGAYFTKEGNVARVKKSLQDRLYAERFNEVNRTASAKSCTPSHGHEHKAARHWTYLKMFTITRGSKFVLTLGKEGETT